MNDVEHSWWVLNREEIHRAMLERIRAIRTPGLAGDMRATMARLYDRAENPSEFVPEAVTDARADLTHLSGVKMERLRPVPGVVGFPWASPSACCSRGTGAR